MIPGRIPARAVVPVLIGAVILPSCTSAKGASSGTPSGRAATARATPSPCVPGGSPPARMGAAMTYDAATRTVVLFGGISGDGTPLNDTWAWDGCHWSQLKPAVSPPGRSFGALAFDASSGKVILFGGGAANADPTRNDTWSWNGATWTEEHPATGPARLSNPLLTDDPANGNLLLFGIGGPRFQTPLTWTWDGKNWTDRHPSKSPPYRNSAALAAGARSGVLLYGGAPAETGTLNDSWAWDGSNWSQLHPSTNPQGGPAFMAHEVARHDVVLVEAITEQSGASTIVKGSSTWTWSGSNWTRQHPSSSPPFELFRSIAYDRSRDRVVLFGGKDVDSNQATNDTWLWDGTNWSPAPGS